MNILASHNMHVTMSDISMLHQKRPQFETEINPFSKKMISAKSNDKEQLS